MHLNTAHLVCAVYIGGEQSNHKIRTLVFHYSPEGAMGVLILSARYRLTWLVKMELSVSLQRSSMLLSGNETFMLFSDRPTRNI